MKNDINIEYENILRETKLKKEMYYRDLDLFKEENKKILRGESEYTKKELNIMIEETEFEINILSVQIEKANFIIKDKRAEVDDIIHLKEHLFNWSEIFDNANNDQKKILLSRVIDIIWVYKDRIEIDFKANDILKEFVGGNIS